MKVFITGATGFIGSNVLKYFFNRGDEIHILLREGSNKWRLENNVSSINTHIGDLTCYHSVESILSNVNPDIVINCSGLVKGFAITDQENVIQSNFVGTVNLVNACIRSNVEILISTGSAYECGFSGNSLPNNGCTGEPIGLYGIVKKAEKEYVAMISQKYKKKYLTARLFTPFGFFDSSFRLVPYLILSILDGKIPKIKTPNSGRDFIFANDIGKIFYNMVTNDEVLQNNTVVNIATGKLTKVNEIVKMLFEIAGLDYMPDYSLDRTSNQYLYAEYREVNELLAKLHVRTSPLFQSLERTFNWFKEYRRYYVD